MTNQELITFYERDIGKLIDEISLFKSEANLWQTHGSLKNPAGNIALHITGGLNHLIGANLLQNGYIRNRELEFSNKNVPKEQLVAQLEALIPMLKEAISQFTPGQIDAPYPKFFDKEHATNSYVLTQLLLHLNYHLGQVNYLRRMLE